MHVYPFFPPQVPSLEIMAVDVGADTEDVDDLEDDAGVDEREE